MHFHVIYPLVTTQVHPAFYDDTGQLEERLEDIPLDREDGAAIGGNTFSENLDFCLKQRFSVVSKV